MSKNLYIVGSIIILGSLFLIKETTLNDAGCTQHLRQNFPLEESNPVLTFSDWKLQFGKTYQHHQEEAYRTQIYLNNLAQIQAHNKLYQSGRTKFFKAANHLSDLSPEEFLSIYNWKQPFRPDQHLGFNDNLGITSGCEGSIMDAPNPPIQVDWDNKVTAVVDQGQCGMDWAIVSVAAVESLYALKVGQLPVLSVQQLLQCSESYGNEGCSGGFMDQAFDYIIDNGLATAKTYPSRTIQSCRYVPNMKFTSFSKCARVPSGNHSKLISAITQQPVSIALDFSEDMRFYAGGIFDGACSTKLTHAMLLTGYGGKEHGTHYWRLRNTLGSTWGSKGYIDILREEKDGAGVCGIQTWPSVPQGIV